MFVANYRLYLRDLSESDAQPIPGTELLGQITQPFFSPDGEWIGFIGEFAESRSLRKIPVRGGASVVITAAAGGVQSGFGATWDVNGEILFANGDGVFAVSGDGGTPERVIALADGEYAIRPQRLPDRDHVLFTLADGDPSPYDRVQIVVQSISSGERQVIVRDGTGGRYVATGHLTYTVGTDLLAVRFDAASRQVEGAPVVVERGVYRPTGGVRAIGQFAIAASGSLALIPSAQASSALTFVDTSTGTIGHPQPFSAATYPRVSPDGSRVAAIEDGATWVYALDASSAPIRVAREDPGMRWMDHSHIAVEATGFRFGQDDQLETINADGLVSDPGRQYRVAKEGGHHPLWSRDGRTLYYAANSAGPVTSLMVVDVRTAPAISFSDPRLVGEELLPPLNQDRQYDATPDGRIVALVPESSALHAVR